ncbi:hypothetical protein ALC57_11980 [Trachymyrmex cornetzi]|uniref:RNase H type-1 domain-containing protein n=1 Tax=Trachymyrmex cornetzi TaxID=471704 RepID=A0A151J1M3_9HYME|nr:hypothetical protein ALC57_11980 [Trachymyrmex cornetzi]
MLPHHARHVTHIPLAVHRPLIPSLLHSSSGASHKFLGVRFDRKMTGREHLKDLITKSRKIVNIISALTGVWWGSHPQSLLSIYRAVLRGSIEYGCQIFQYRKNKTIFKCLERSQWKAIRLSMGYRISTPINVMLAEACELPLRIRFSYLSSRYLIKNFSRHGSLSINNLEHLEEISCRPRIRLSICQKVPIFKRYIMIKHYKSYIKRSRFLPAFLYPFFTNILTLSYSCAYTGTKDDTPNELIIRQFQEFLYPLDQDDYVSFYTDGSRFDSEDYTGSGTYAPALNLEIAHRLSGTSVFTAEAWVLLVTIKIICDRDIAKAVVFSDSRSVLDSLASTRSDLSNYLIYAIKHQFFQATSKNLNIKLVWIPPSHKGISGNERADELAKLGATRGDRVDLDIPFPDYLSEARSTAITQFKSHLDEEFRIKGLHYEQYFRSQSLKPWFNKLSLNREEIVLINRIRSNHYNLNYSLYRKDIVSSKAYPCGDPHQDINHIIFYCPLTAPKSGKLISYIHNFPDTQKNIFPLFKNPNPKLVRLLLAFLKSNNLSI